MIASRIDTSNGVFSTNRLAPLAYPYKMPVYDFSREALMQSNMRSIYYLMFASGYGAYYYMYISPHSMYLMLCSALSFFFTVSFSNYQMIMYLSVADL